MSTTTIPGFTTSKDLDDDSLATQSIIVNQLALNLNESLKHTNQYRSELKYRLKNVSFELIRSEVNYDKIFDKNEAACINVYNTLDLMF